MSLSVDILIPYREQYGREEALACVRDHFQKALPEARQVLADDPDPESFNRGRAINQAARQTFGDILVFADADLLPPPDNLRQAVERVAQGVEAIVIPFDQIAYLDPAGSRLVIDSKDWRMWGPVYVEREWTRKSNGGCNVLPRRVFEALGGFDDRFRGWGFEDSALALAWETFYADQEWLNGTAVHLWHPQNSGAIPVYHQAGLDLCRRYEAAFKDRKAMWELLAEDF